MAETPCKILRSIVLSGGGTRCISFVGALLFLRSRGFLAGVTRWYCCSAGSLIAMLFVLETSDILIKKFDKANYIINTHDQFLFTIS